MFGKNVDLKQVVNEFLSKEQAKKDKINKLIADLERTVKETRSKIAGLNDNLVELQLNNETKGVAKLRSEIRDLRLALSDAEDEIAGYQRQLDISPAREKEIERIRETAAKAQKERHELVAKLISEKENLDKQILELQNKSKELNSEITILSRKTEGQDLRPIMRYMDPRVVKLPSYEQDTFFRKWVDGEDVEDIFIRAGIAN